MRVDLTELDYDELVQELAKHLGVEISDNFMNHTDLQVSHWNTADGYDVVVMTEDARHLCWEHDVYYYKPDTETIIERIKELDEDAVVYIEDFEEFLSDYSIIEFLMDEDPQKYDPDEDILDIIRESGE